jgi:hypothetical protein
VFFFLDFFFYFNFILIFFFGKTLRRNDEYDLIDKNLLSLISDSFVFSKEISLKFEELAEEFLKINSPSLYKLFDSNFDCHENILSHIVEKRLKHLVEHLKVGDNSYCLRVSIFNEQTKFFIIFFQKRSPKIIDRSDFEQDIGIGDGEDEVGLLIENEGGFEFSQNLFNSKTFLF